MTLLVGVGKVMYESELRIRVNVVVPILMDFGHGGSLHHLFFLQNAGACACLPHGDVFVFGNYSAVSNIDNTR